MRKHLLLIMMLTALFPWSLRAQTLTINDGIVTNKYIPIYGYWADMGSSYTETQFILPSGDLTAMVGSDITSLKFYADYNQDFDNASWDIYMQETNSTTLSSIASYSGNTLVYSGHLAVVSNQLVIEFDASYPYNGNNLLITFHKTQAGTCSSQYDSFYGVLATNGASAYYNSSSFTPQPFLPKVTFTYGAPPTCPKPTELAVSDITSAGATLSWTSSASNFVVAYGTGTDPDQMTTVNAATNSAALTGLNANTVYNVFVKAVCSETDESDWSAMKTFRTECAAIDLTTLGTIGFETSEGFVSGYNPSSPNCWTFGNMQSASTSYIPYIYNSTYYAHEGNNSLSLYAYKSSSMYSPTDADSAYAVMPEFSATNLSQYMLRFYARQGSTSTYYSYANNLVVGVMTDPMDMSTFVQVGSANVVGTTYAQYEVSLASYSGNGNYIAFLAAVDPESTASYRYAQYYVDNLEVMVIPSCVRPADVAVSDITNESAELAWTERGTATAWNIQYRVAGGENEWVTINNVTANPYTLTGLTAATNYEVQVQAACNPTEQSEWSNMVTFTTKAVATVVDATHPFNEDFESSSVSFEFINGTCTNKWTIGTATNNGGSNALYISNNGGTTNAYTHNSATVYATKLVGLSAATYHLSYDWKCIGERYYGSDYDYLRVFLAPSSCTFTAGSMPSGLSSSAVPTGWIALDGGAALNQQETWQNHTQDFSVTEGTYYLVFMWCNDDGGGYNPPAAVDNISLTLPSCATPVNVEATDITAHGAILSWTSSASNFVVAYGTGTDPDQMTTVNAATNSAALTGLNANTVYNVFVKAVCSETDKSEWSAMKTFRTECAAIDLTTLGTIGFETSEGFVSGTNPSSPNCWTFGNMQSASTSYIPYIYNSTYYAYEGNNSLSLYACKSSYTDADSAYAAMPEFSATNLSQYMLRFYARQGSTSSAYAKNLVVGVMTDPMDMRTFVQVGSANVVGTTYAQYEVSLASYSGNGNYIAFLAAVDPESTASTRYAQYYVDNLEVMVIPSCFPVASVSFADVERTSMTINWTKNSNPAAVNTDYQVVLSTTQLDADGLAAAHPVDVLNATTYTATNLERNTLYYVYVRSACGGDDYSEWVEATQRTLGLMVCDNTIGDGTIGAGGVPVYSSYGNTYSQQIFTAEELTAAGIVAGNITGISYDWNGGGSYQKMLSIYIGSTSKSSFSSASDWVPGSALQLGYGPAVHESTTSGKVDYPFSTPFNWDGTSNIVIATIVNQHNGSTSSSGFTAKGTTATDMAIYKYEDSYPYSYDPSETTGCTGNSKAGSRANISFCQDMPACPEITNLAAETTVDEAIITWTPSTGDYVGSYVIIHSDEQLSQGDLNQQYEENNHHGDESVTTPTVTVSHLYENTQYYIYISTVCNANSHDDGMSDWVEFSYKTKANCLTPVDLVATVNGKKDVTVTWTNGSYDPAEERSEQESNFYWILADDDITNGGTETPDKDHERVVAHNFDGENGDAITDDHAQITFSEEAEINVLDHNQIYYFYVRNDCGGDGAWDYITFTTPDECPAVVNLAVSNQTAHTALLTWDKGEYGDETEWKVAWGSNEFYTTEQSFLVYGLAAETTTTVSVYAACDKNHGVFGTAATVEVTTTAEGGNLVQVGNGTSTTSYFFPISAWHHNSYTQQLYTATEIGKSSGTITSILFNYFWSTTTTRKITVYMGNTETANLSSGYISTNEMTEVFSAQAFTFTNTNGNWCEIELETPFNYTGGNIVVAVYMDYNSCETQYSSTTRFYYTSSASNMARYCTSGTKTAGAISFTNGVPSSSYSTAVSYRPNIKLTFEAVACPKVTTFNVDDITTTTANVSWMPAGGEMTWNYVVSTSATLDADALDAHTDASVIAHAEDYAQRFVELNGLTPDTQYYLYVQTICDAETVSAWSLPYEFVTVATCVAPTALLVNNITNESAELAWTENGTATAWQVDYSTDGETWTTVDASTNPYTLTGLTDNTYYYVKVRSYCSDEDQSVYTAVANFTTECDPTIITEANPYIENFDAETFPPDCWSQTQLALTNTWSRTTSTKHGSTGGAAYIPDITAGTKTALVTNAIAFDGSTDYQVIFWMYRASNSYQSKVDEAIHVYVGPDADNVTNATEIGVINEHYLNAPVEAAPGWYEYTFDVPENTAGNKYVLFVYHNQYGAGAYIDDITIRETPSCVKPSGLAVSNITNESAELAWTENGTATAWQVDYSTDGETWTTVDADTNPYTLTDLTSNTYYYVKVRSYCSAEDQSEYTAVANFTTECDALVIGTSGYTEDFESYDAVSSYYTQGTMPDCWSSIFTGTSTSYNVKTSSYGSYALGSGNYILITVGTYSSYGTANYAILPSISNDYDNLKVSFDYKMSSSSTGSTVSFGYLTDAADATTFTAIGSALTNSTSNVSKEITLDGYNVPSGACLAFKAYATTSYSFYFSFDNLNIIDTTIVIYAPTALSVSDIGYSGATVSWTAGSTEEKWQYVYGESGFTPDWTNPSEVTATTCTLTGLNSSTDYDVYVRSWYDAETISEPVMISFTTLCDPISTFPYVEKFDGLTTNGQIPDCWNNDEGTTTNTTYKWSYDSSYGTGVTGTCVRFDSYNNDEGMTNFLKSPVLALPDEQIMMLSFQWKNPTGGDFSVYISTDGGQTHETALATGLTAQSSWKSEEISLAAYAGQNVVIVFKGTSNWEYGDARIYLDDVIVAPAGTFIKNGAISTADNWSGAEVPATTGYIAAEATVLTDFTIADLNILEGGKVTVNSGATLTVTGTLTNSDAANIVIEDGGQLVNASATKATIQKEIEAYASASGTDADGWYLIASPVTDAAASMVTTGTYDFYTHDEAAYMWRNYKVEANQTAYSWLTNGYGYLYANAVSQTLNFAGTVAADGEKEIALAYTSTGDNTGWNLLGNHTAHNVTIESDFDLLSVKVMDINGIDYTDKLVSTDTFAPCEGFFVQATEAGQHVTINPDMVRSQNAPQGFIRLNLVDNNTPVFTDVAYITMEGGIGSENITFSEVSPQLYVPIDGVDYSVAVVDAEQTIIPVSFKATANSSYTISLNLINAHFETVILRDLKTGIDTDLKAGDYVFSGNIDDAENRFNLILAVEAPEGIEEDNAPFAYQSGSDIIFTDTYGTVQVMDVLGRVMSETRIDGDARISTRGFVSGTYVLRLLGSESVRTQKIVVK